MLAQISPLNGLKNGGHHRIGKKGKTNENLTAMIQMFGSSCTKENFHSYLKTLELEESQEKATQTVLEQAEVLSEAWAIA